MKLKKMLLIRVRNSVQNVCTLQPLVDLKCLFMYVKFTILCTYLFNLLIMFRVLKFTILFHINESTD